MTDSFADEEAHSGAEATFNVLPNPALPAPFVDFIRQSQTNVSWSFDP